MSDIRRRDGGKLTMGLHLCAAICAAPALSAQDNPSARGRPLVVEEVVVTATKRATALQDVPVAVSAITAEDITTRGLTQYADFLNGVPGVFFQDAGPGASAVRIRGVSEGGGGSSTVATYFGETVTSVLTNHGGQPDLRLVDIDRVEVLRGPQGTLFGANSLAGVVRTIPTAPNLEQFEIDLGTRGFVTEHSSDESYHVEGILNVPLVSERLALRLVAYKDEIAGYIDNVVSAQDAVDYSESLELPPGTLVTPAVNAFTRRDINSEDTWGARAALTWRATEQLQFDLTYATQDTTLESEPHATPSAGEYNQSRALDVFEAGGYGEQLDIATVVATYDWDNASLVSASSWTRKDRFSNQDVTFLAEGAFGAPIPWGLRDQSWGRLFTQEVRLSSRGEGPLQWIAGAFYLNEDADLAQFIPDFSCPTCLPELLAGEDFAFDVPRARFSEQEQRSVFGEVSYDVLPRWTVGIGARYVEDDLVNIDVAAFGLIAAGTDTTPTRTEGSAHEFNPSAYVRFKATQDMTWYVQAARGFRSGEVNSELPDQCLAEAGSRGLGPISDPDTLWNYELGMKSRFAGGLLNVNAAAYKQRWKDVQLIIALDCGFSGIINGGDVDGQGVELEIESRVTQALSFNVALAVSDNEFDRTEPGVGFVAGERMPLAAEKNGSFGAQYDFSLGADWSGFARADYTYLGDIRYKFGDEVVMQKSFDTTNVRVGFIKDDLAVELFGRNITDERAVVTTDDPGRGGNQVLLRPRELGVQVRYAFH